MKRLFVITFSLLGYITFAQTNSAKQDYNLGFEKYEPGQKLPESWMQWGVGYLMSADSTHMQEGKNAVLIQAPVDKKLNTFGCVANSIPALWSAKEIELKGYMKFTDVKDGFVGLMLRVDGQERPIQFSNMQKVNLTGSADWKEYSVKLPYSGDAKMIHIGAILTGTGKLWVDNFKVYLDGKILNEVKYKEMAKADGDKEFDTSSAVNLGNLNESQIKDLAELGQIWGFLKYYHPAVAKGDYNWDYELFRILPKFQSATSRTERRLLLIHWLESLGPINEKKQVALLATDYAVKPDLEWISSAGFSDKMQSNLMAIKNAERPSEHYYIGSMPNEGNPEFRNERTYSAMKYPDAGFRLLALFRYWNMIQYFFPYRNIIEGNWNTVLAEFISDFINAADETQYKLAMLRLIARVGDTHANIYGDPALNKYFGIRNAAVEISFIENKAVITGFHDKLLGEHTTLKRGDVIEKINGQSVADIVKEQLPLTPASNYPTQLRGIAEKILRTNDSSLAIVYRRGEKSGKVTVETYDQRSLPIARRSQRKDTCFKMVRPNIAYLYPGSIRNSYLPLITPEILKSKGLIIDLRCYPSDFLVYTFTNLLLPAPAPFVKFSAADINEPGLFRFGPPIKTGIDNPGYFKGQVVILINEITQSSAEFTTMAFRTAPKVKVIGSTTAGADGDISAIGLPGNLRTFISGLGVFYPDGKTTQRVGIVPDIEVRPTIKGIREGRDELMERAIEIIEK